MKHPTIDSITQWMTSGRFEGLTRLYGPRQVLEQRGSIGREYDLARQMAEQFYERLRERFAERRSITTFGPYSPGQAVVMKRAGIEGIYLGGWATSAKGSVTEDPGPDLATYPLSQVPDEASSVVRALLAADCNQAYARARMGASQGEKTPAIDYRPFIIADADTGHGGEAHVRNLIRRFVEVGVPGFHIEDQKPGLKKCGHQGGKVLVGVHEQLQRLNAARFQLDVMGVPGILVARTDAEAATLLDSNADARDHPFILGATNPAMPSFKSTSLAILKRFHEGGVKDVNGHALHAVDTADYGRAYRWLTDVGLMAAIDDAVKSLASDADGDVGTALDAIASHCVDLWQAAAGLKTYGQAVGDSIRFYLSEGRKLDTSVQEWTAQCARMSHHEARDRARSLGVDVPWDWDLPRSPEGFYPIQGGIPYAVTRSLAAAPFADLLWMETKTASLDDARRFAEAIHAVFPDQMLAYNLSPSFSWDTTGMTEQQMTDFPKRIGELGFVFNFITYGGHQVDGLAADEFATALRDDGMLALARLQRKLRLLESPYRLPQTLVGGPRADAALMATSGRTATTKAMGKGSTQSQHLVPTEVPPSLLGRWLTLWRETNHVAKRLVVDLKPYTAGSDLLALTVLDEASRNKAAEFVFANIKDRRGHSILSVRDQTNVDTELRQKRLMTLIQLFLIHRYKVVSVHYVAPTEDNQKQAAAMRRMGIFSDVAEEVGQIIVARVNNDTVQALTAEDQTALKKLITKSV